MPPVEQLLDMLKLAAQLESRLALIQHNPDLAKSAKEAIYGTRWALESVLDELVKGLARQQVADHLSGETLHVENPSA